ncbi:MAG: hypothetical protein ACKVOU_14280 [Cytophagales bacterium]
MDQIFELAKIILPATLVLYAVFLVVRSFLNKEYDRKVLELKMDNAKVILPIRLQAYERICLLLERISLNNLIIRVNDPAYNSLQLQQVLLSEIRNEYNHNLSQQVYMSDEAWNITKKAIEDIVSLINTSGEQVQQESRGIELAKKIFENHLNKSYDTVNQALTYIKAEIRVSF